MPLEVEAVYLGDHDCTTAHVPSGDSLKVGPMAGATFSPVHLVGSALAT